jgi:hypothetical protein
MSITTASLVESLLQHDRPAGWWGLDTADPLVDDSGHGYTLTAVGTPSNSASLHTRGDTGASGCRDFNGTTGAYDVFGTIYGENPETPSYVALSSAGAQGAPVPLNIFTGTAYGQFAEEPNYRAATTGVLEVGSLLVVGLNTNTAGATITVAPAGWTQLGSTINYTAGTAAVYHRTATQEDIDGRTHTWEWSAGTAMEAVLAAWSGCDPDVATLIFDFDFVATGSSTDHSTGTISVPANAARLVVIWMSDSFAINFQPEMSGDLRLVGNYQDPVVTGNNAKLAFLDYEVHPDDPQGVSTANTSTATQLGAAIISFGAPDVVAEDALDVIDANITLHALVNPDTVAAGTRTIIRKHEAWGLNVNAAALQFVYRDGGDVDRTVTGPNLSASTTQRIWVVDDGSLINFYVNGTKTTAARTGTAGYTMNENRITIGAYHNGAAHTNFWDGRIDEPAVFDAAFSEEMVRAHELAHTQGTFGDFWHTDKNGAYPRAKVELAITSNPGDPCPVFIDVNSAKVKARGAGHGIRVEAGVGVISASRDFEQDRMQAGTMFLTLGNRDRGYDTLKPRRVIRFRAQVQTDGPVFPIFYGYTGAPQFPRPEFGKDSTVVLTATDTFTALSLSTIQEEMTREAEAPGVRLEAVLEDVSGIELSLGEGKHELALAELQGVSRLDHSQAVAETDGGNFFADARGRMVFQDGHHRTLNERTVRATYGWKNTSATFPVKDMHPIVDEARLFTTAEITPASGNVQRAENAAAALEFFGITRAVTTLHNSDADALAFANHTKNAYSTPHDRIPNLVLQPAAYKTAPKTMWATVLGHEISHRIKTIEKPIGASVEVPREHFVEGVAHEITGDTWQVVFSLSPAELDGEFLIIGTGEIGDDGGATSGIIGW